MYGREPTESYDRPRFAELPTPSFWTLGKAVRFADAMETLAECQKQVTLYLEPAKALTFLVLSGSPWRDSTDPRLDRIGDELSFGAALGMAVGEVERTRNSPRTITANAKTALVYAGVNGMKRLQSKDGDLPPELSLWFPFTVELGFFASKQGMLDTASIATLSAFLPPLDPPPPKSTQGSSSPAAPNPAAGWHVDPTSRFEYRFWDGAHWTEHVATSGAQSVDSI